MGKEKKEKKPQQSPQPASPPTPLRMERGVNSTVYWKVIGGSALENWGIGTRKNVQFVRKSLDDY